MKKQKCQLDYPCYPTKKAVELSWALFHVLSCELGLHETTTINVNFMRVSVIDSCPSPLMIGDPDMAFPIEKHSSMVSLTIFHPAYLSSCPGRGRDRVDRVVFKHTQALELA